MREELSEKIGEHEYIFTQMMPEEATRVALRIMKVLGLQVGGAIGSLQVKPGGEQEDNDLNIDMELLGKSLGVMFQQIDEDETINTFNKLLSSVLYNGKPLKMNSVHFQGKTFQLFKVITQAARVNFADFFEESSGVVGQLKNAYNIIRERITSGGNTGESSSQK